MASANEAFIAAAGSGKTEYLLGAALADPSKRSLIVTYTNENMHELQARLWTKTAGQSTNVTTMTWFEFLLRDGVKPYQSYKTSLGRIRSINFVTENSMYAKRSDFDAYYLDGASNVYSDAVSDLAFELDIASGGKVVDRLATMYDQILVDEVQDMAGYDLEVLHLLLKSSIKMIMVGDPRQAIYLTNRSNKNSQYRGAKLIDWIDARVNDGLCVKRSLDVSHRCPQSICDFADAIYPDMPPTKSGNQNQHAHMGVVLVHKDHIDDYLQAFAPQELRWDRRSPLAGPTARNFGQVKGQSFDRVLIHPTGTISDFLEKGKTLAEVTASKFYVAITRARHSVAIVTRATSTKTKIPFWLPAGLEAGKDASVEGES